MRPHGSEANASAPGMCADENIVTTREEEEEDSGDEGEDGSAAQRPAKSAVPLAERDLYRRPITESLLGRWVQSGTGIIAQDLRMKMRVQGVDVSSRDGLERCLPTRHLSLVRVQQEVGEASMRGKATVGILHQVPRPLRPREVVLVAVGGDNTPKVRRSTSTLSATGQS